MPALRIDDGVALHVSECGAGPLVVLASYWSMPPGMFKPLIADLGAVVRRITAAAPISR